MKKLLIVLLVLGTASLAQAAVLELSIDGSRNGEDTTQEITICTDTTITIDVYCNDAASPADDFWLGITASDGDGAWVADTDVTYVAMGNARSLTVSAYDSDWWYGTTGVSTDPAPTTGIWCEIDFECTSEGDAYIYLYDYTYTTVRDTILVHQIPEPMTIALLGLGGLFLRRRK